MDGTFTSVCCVGKYIYTFFNIILYFVKMYNYCVKKKNKTVCEGEVKCKEGCENCVGKIFLETYT